MDESGESRKLEVIQLLYSRNLRSGGVAGAVPALSDALCEAGARVSLLTPRARDDWRDRPFTLGEYPSWRAGRAIDFNPRMFARLRRAARTSAIVHWHDVWSLQGAYAALACRGSRCRRVVSPRGSLAPGALAFSKRKKKVMWSLLSERAVAGADCLHATSELEYEELRRFGLRNPVAIVPNGIDVPSVMPERTRSADDSRRLLFLSRLHGKKGVDVLLRAWQQVQGSFPDWELHVTGPDDGGYLPGLMRLAQDLCLERVEFTGPKHGEDKTKAYVDSDLFVLPSRSENFGSVVGEALAHRVPVVVTRSTPWSEVETHDCGWWIEGGVSPLVDRLREAMALPRQRLADMGIAGRRWIGSEFRWERVGRDMLETYRWLLGGGAPPPWVMLE